MISFYYFVRLYYNAKISSAHKLTLPYKSKCTKLHGHNYKIELQITGSINEHGMIIDFYHLKREIMKYDHVYLNDILKQPTTENFARFLIEKIRNLPQAENITHIKLKISETENSSIEEWWVKEDK